MPVVYDKYFPTPIQTKKRIFFVCLLFNVVSVKIPLAPLDIVHTAVYCPSNLSTLQTFVETFSKLHLLLLLSFQ